jgi:hypothetical protein
MTDPEPQRTKSVMEPEGLLFHYTDQNGLLGILESKSIWATHIRYLNDTSEGNIVSRAILDELSSRLDTGDLFRLFGLPSETSTGLTEPVDDEILGHGIAMASWVTSLNVFAVSFSEFGDSLSQWRAYSGRSGGYSIGFRPDYLRAVGNDFLVGRPDRFYSNSDALSRCIYYDEEAKVALKSEIQKLVSAFIEEAMPIREVAVDAALEGLQTPAAIALRHFLNLGKRNAIFKDSGFREEAEWRLAFLLNPNSLPADINLRPGGSMLVPYLRISLRLDDQPIGIWKVIVGPCPHPSEAANAVKMLLESQGFKGIEVVSSQIPYRNW